MFGQSDGRRKKAGIVLGLLALLLAAGGLGIYLATKGPSVSIVGRWSSVCSTRGQPGSGARIVWTFGSDGKWVADDGVSGTYDFPDAQHVHVVQGSGGDRVESTEGLRFTASGMSWTGTGYLPLDCSFVRLSASGS